MTDLNITGPALRLVYAYLGDASISDAEKLAFAGDLLALVGDHQSEIQQALRAAMRKNGVRVDPATMLRLAATALVREMMTMPDGGDIADWNHRWHCVVAANEIEKTFEQFGYWTVAAIQARLDLQSARTRAVKVHIADEEPHPDVLSAYWEASQDLAAQTGEGDWTAEDDRLVIIGKIADTIETMPLPKLQHVLEAVVGIRDLD